MILYSSSCSGFNATTIWMLEQLGLAMMPRFGSVAMACGLTSGTTSGFGVGLAVCRRIADVHGGRIWVVSEPGEGACFHLTVPVWSGQSTPQGLRRTGGDVPP